MTGGNMASIGSSIPKTHFVAEETKQAARRVVCGNAIDRQDAEALMKILGIHPGQGSEELETESGYFPRTPHRTGWT